MESGIVVHEDASELAREAAQHFARQSVDASRSRGRFSVALSGGSTPSALYQLLAEEPYRGQIPWADVHVFWGDERCVPPDDPDSNYGQAQASFLSRAPIPSGNVHRIQGELDPSAAARVYDAALQGFFCGPRIRFDMVLLGLGTDGHTASLFPGSPAVQEAERLAAAVVGEYGGRPARRCRRGIALPPPEVAGGRRWMSGTFLPTAGTHPAAERGRSGCRGGR
jgi:6-phosphogluconolactonase